MKKKFICTVCGYIYEGTEAPEKCPICKAPASKFKEMEDAVDDDMTFATVHVLGQAYKDGVNEDVIKGFVGMDVRLSDYLLIDVGIRFCQMHSLREETVIEIMSKSIFYFKR